ncbi:MAG: tetratricopeptide repeat protein [Verrucomicrobia bacterium]|nr:tetratricopeptide repeat protein [Verrucomicrobiota bacterium]
MSDPSTNPVPLGEIIQGPSAFEIFLDRNQKSLAVAAVVVALSIGGYMIYRTIQADHRADAGAALSAAKDLADLEKIKADFNGTPSAASAALAIADKQWNNSQQDEAIGTLREIIQKYSDHPAQLLAQSTLAYRLLAQGKTGDAGTAFQAVIDNPDSHFLAPAALIALGDIARKSGDKEKAEEAYKRVIKDFSDSKFAPIATERRNFINFLAPTEVEPPPTPEAPPSLISRPDSPEQPSNASTDNPLLQQLGGALDPAKDSKPEDSRPESPTSPPDAPDPSDSK